MTPKAISFINIGIILLTLFSPIINLTKTVQSESQETIFGINYVSTHWHYDLYYLSDEELNRDFSLFETQGIKIVILPVIWKYIEPTRGQYNEAAFNDLKRICAAAEAHGLEVIIDVHTLMQDGSWTMPDWLSPRKFQTIFTDNDARSAWLSFLSYTANKLNNVSNLHSWHMMNEPYRTDWACDVNVDDFLVLWREMKATISQFSDKPVSIRFAEDSLSKYFHFGHDSRIYDLLDYVAINWYEDHSTVENLTVTVADIRSHGKEVMISEFGYDCMDDSLQREKVTSYVNMFESLEIPEVSSWFWRADNDAGPPSLPGTEYNMAKDALGTPRPAFYAMRLPKTIIVDDNGPADFAHIQDAVDMSITGDTILVRAGTYPEDVTIQGPETGQKDITLVGDGRQSIITGSVSVSFSDSTIRGFTILSGIDAGYGSANLEDNLLEGGANAWRGSLRLVNNTVENHGAVIGEFGGGYYYNNTFRDCSVAITSDGAVEVVKNSFRNCDVAIQLWTYGGNDIRENIASTCSTFLQIDGGVADTGVIGNTITNGDYGIYIEGVWEPPTGFTCYSNNFIEIVTNIYISDVVEGLEWNTGYPQGGNYWSGHIDQDLYRGPGQDQPGSDGIWDHPYVISNGGQDNYPLVSNLDNGATFFRDGFEEGLNTFSGTIKTTGEMVILATTLPHHDSYSGIFSSNGGGGTEHANSFKTFPSSPEIYARGYFRVSKSGITDNSDRFYFIVLKSERGSNLAYAGWRRTNGATQWCLVIRNGAGYVTKYSTSTPTLNKWYSMELYWVKGSSGFGELYVDGAKVCSAQGNTASFGDAAVANFGLTEVYNCASTIAYADCVQLSSGYMGPEPPNTIIISSGQDTGASSNLGSVTFDEASGSLPRSVSKQAGSTYSTQYATVTGYVFSRWEVTGGLKLSSATANPVTVTVTGDGALKAVYKTVAASITVTSPNTALSWVRGTSHTITWTPTGSPSTNVKIELLKSNVVDRVISSSTANDGSFSWTIPTTQAVGTDYVIRITSTTNAEFTDSSNANFAIAIGALTVTSPNDGNAWVRGIAHTVTWSRSGSTGSYVKIELLKDGVVLRVISSGTANDGLYSWMISATQTPGTDYKIRITSTTNMAITDSSNSNFSIVS